MARLKTIFGIFVVGAIIIGCAVLADMVGAFLF